jgi:flagellar basal body-associated protein FliL
MPRYVPKTYNNRRGMRIFIGVVITIVLSVVILFLILFFIFREYVVEGQLDIPWLTDEATPTEPSEEPPTEPPSEYDEPFEDLEGFYDEFDDDF